MLTETPRPLLDLAGQIFVVAMSIAALVLQLAVVHLPAAQDVFATTMSPTAGQLPVGAGLALAMLLVIELEKALRRRTVAETRCST